MTSSSQSCVPWLFRVLDRVRPLPLLRLWCLFALCAMMPPAAVPQTHSTDPLRESKAPNKKYPVEIAEAIATAQSGDCKQVVKLTVSVQTGYLLFANQPENRDHLTAAPHVTIVAGKPLVACKVSYPAGEAVSDEVLGRYYVYRGKFVIRAVVEREPKDVSPLEIKIRVQAVESQFVGRCLLPTVLHARIDKWSPRSAVDTE